MKRILSLFLVFLAIGSQCFAADQWDEAKPAGSELPGTIDDLIRVNNEALDRLNINARFGLGVNYATASTLTVLSGSIAIPNSAGTTVRWRGTTSSTTITWADIDTGAEASSTQYYLYATADTDITGIVFKISTSSSAPSGSTYYRKIGYFYNNLSSNIVNVGNIGSASNAISVSGTSDISTSSTSLLDMTDMVIYFVSSGGPIDISFDAPINSSAAGFSVEYSISVDGVTEKKERAVIYSASAPEPCPIHFLGLYSSGSHTIKIQWRAVDIGTIYQQGSAIGTRNLTAREH